MDQPPSKPTSLRPEQKRLVEEHLTLVEQIAASIKKALPPEVEKAELIALGREGLTDAALRYDPRRGVSFTTFAGYRVKGAIFDGIRKNAYLGRSEYARNRELLQFRARANEYLAERAEEETPTSVEAAVEDAERYATDLTTIYISSLNAYEDAGLDLAFAPEPDPEEQLSTHQQLDLLKTARASLDPKEAELLRLHYDEGLSLAETARRLGISKPWASRLHARAIQSLALKMGASPPPEFFEAVP